MKSKPKLWKISTTLISSKWSISKSQPPFAKMKKPSAATYLSLKLPNMEISATVLRTPSTAVKMWPELWLNKFCRQSSIHYWRVMCMSRLKALIFCSIRTTRPNFQAGAQQRAIAKKDSGNSFSALERSSFWCWPDTQPLISITKMTHFINLWVPNLSENFGRPFPKESNSLFPNNLWILLRKFFSTKTSSSSRF